MRPVYEHDSRHVAENERVAALLAVVDALKGADLTDATLFAVDVDARKLARLVRERVPVKRVGLAEPAERLHDAVLDESCMALVQVVKQLPAFEPRALVELLGRFSQVVEGIAEVLHRLPRTTLDAPRGSEHDEEFRARYLGHISETLDELEQFGIDVRRYKPRTLVSVAYLSLQSLKELLLRQLPGLNLAPLASLPQLRELTLIDINEPVDLSPLAQMDHRLRVELWNTPTVGEPGPLVKVRRR